MRNEGYGQVLLTSQRIGDGSDAKKAAKTDKMLASASTCGMLFFAEGAIAAMSDRRDLTPPNQAPVGVPTAISITPTATLDLSHMSEQERKTLLMDYTRGMLDVGRRANDLNVDVVTLRNTLDTFSQNARRAQDEGTSVTITHTQTTAIGRTEISMGNTAAAKTGKLTRSQTGERDWTPIYIIAGIVAVVVIALAFAK